MDFYKWYTRAKKRTIRFTVHLDSSQTQQKSIHSRLTTSSLTYVLWIFPRKYSSLYSPEIGRNLHQQQPFCLFSSLTPVYRGNGRQNVIAWLGCTIRWYFFNAAPIAQVAQPILFKWTRQFMCIYFRFFHEDFSSIIGTY